VGKKKRFTDHPFAYHQEIELEVSTLTNLGLGLGRVELANPAAGDAAGRGWVVMVPFTLPGERVRARVYRNHKNFSEADLVEVLSPSGDRVLRHEVEVNASSSAVWRAFTTSEGLRGFVAPVAAIDLRLGGIWEATYDPAGHLGDPANILNEVISYVPGRMLSIRVARTPPGFEHGDVARAVWTVIEITDLGQGRSRVSTSMCGWKTGGDWEAVYAFFEQGNTIVAERLRDYLSKAR
jgi:uncharacterized protein YndB with AHSA1/START domain/predicted RNA-binding protein with TRAM domain